MKRTALRRSNPRRARKRQRENFGDRAPIVRAMPRLAASSGACVGEIHAARPAEMFFRRIQPGDTPSNSPDAALASVWVREYLAQGSLARLHELNAGFLRNLLSAEEKAERERLTAEYLDATRPAYAASR